MYLVHTRILPFFAILQLQPHLNYADAKCTPSRKPFIIPLGNCTLPGTNVDSWGISSIEISGINACLSPSMFVDNTLLMDTSLCQDGHRGEGENTQAQCESRRGGPVNISALNGAFTAGTESDLAVDRNWVNLMDHAGIKDNVYGTIGKINMNLPNDLSLTAYPVGVINQGQDHNAAHLGLGPNSTFLRALGASGMDPALGFGLNVGSQGAIESRSGTLVIDGYDAASVSGAWHNYSINHNTPDPGDRICPLQVVVEELTVKFANGTQSGSLLGSGLGRSTPSACIEPYDNYFRFPTFVFDSFADVIGWSECCQDVNASKSLYVVEPGLLFPAREDFTGSLVIKLSDGFVVEIPPEEMARPLPGIDQSGKRVLQTNLTEVAVFRSRDAPLSKMALGKAFLSQVYLTVDYKADQFRLAALNKDVETPNPVPFSANSTIECEKDGSMDAKAIGFTVAFSILAAVLIVLAIFWYMRHRKRSKEHRQYSFGNHRGLASQPELIEIHRDQIVPPPEPATDRRPSELSSERRRAELEYAGMQ